MNVDEGILNVIIFFTQLSTKIHEVNVKFYESLMHFYNYGTSG